MTCGTRCVDCDEKYDCDYYQAYLGFGKFNHNIAQDAKIVNRPSKEMNLDYYDNLNY